MTLEPDGKAAGCNPAQVGSTPTGVSGGGLVGRRPGFKQATGAAGHRRSGPVSPTVGALRSANGFGTGRYQVVVAQR